MAERDLLRALRSNTEPPPLTAHAGLKSGLRAVAAWRWSTRLGVCAPGRTVQGLYSNGQARSPRALRSDTTAGGISGGSGLESVGRLG